MSEKLRQAIQQSGRSLYAIAKGADVPYPSVHHFVSGKRSLSLDAAEKLAEHLGLVLVEQE